MPELNPFSDDQLGMRYRTALKRAASTGASLIVLTLSTGLYAADMGDVAPAWTLPGPKGEEVKYPESTGGSPAVLLFWATWCPYCRATMPYLDEIRADYLERGIKIFAINIKEDGDPIAHMRELGFDFVLALDGDPVADAYGVRYTPGLFVVDAHGRILFRRRPTESQAGKTIAEFWAAEVREALDTALAEDYEP